ncbi:MAG: sensor histidine kinase [Rhodospirillales bacterium]|nr:sensor histidine kinase [Rhodospirillales bacterium]
MAAGSIRRRLIVTAALWLAAALVVTELVLIGLFKAHVTRRFDQDLESHIEELAALAEIGADGRLFLARTMADPRFQKPYSGWYWRLSVEGQAPERSRSLWDGDLLPPASPPGGPFALQGPRGEALRALLRPLSLPDAAQPVQFLIAGPKAEIDRAAAEFATQASLAFAALGLGLLVLVLMQIGWGLRPLASLRLALGAVRSGKSPRLQGEFPLEIKPLSDEVNSLLDHNDAVLERTRTQVGNLAHALKTPLTSLINEIDSLDPATAARLKPRLDALRQGIDHHLKRARMAGAGLVVGQRTEVAASAESLIRALGRIATDRRLHASLEGTRGLWFQGERQDLEEMLGTLLENAFAWAKSRIRVTLEPLPGQRLAVAIEDDGPGIPPEKRAQAIERGRRLDETQPGSGLGLAIAADLAQLYGGRLDLDQSALGGLRAKLELPAAPQH